MARWVQLFRLVPSSGLECEKLIGSGRFSSEGAGFTSGFSTFFGSSAVSRSSIERSSVSISATRCTVSADQCFILSESFIVFSKTKKAAPEGAAQDGYAAADDKYGHRRYVSMYLDAVAVTVAEAVELPDSVIEYGAALPEIDTMVAAPPATPTAVSKAFG